MSVNNVNRFLNIEDSHLRVVSGNVYAQALNVGGITVGSAHGLQNVTNVSNTTNNTIEFTNTETSLVTSGDINMLHSSNNAAINLNSNVVTEFPRSKKLIKYPRVALTSASQDGYVVTASSTLSTGTPANVPYTVFDESLTSFWHTQYPYYNTSNGSYAPGQTAGGTGTPANGTTLPTNELVSGHQGEWISLELPNKIKLDRLKVTGSTRLASGVTQFPKDVVVAVSDTGLSGSWSVLQTATLTSQNVSNHSVTIDITTDASYYRYFALIVKSINSTATYSAVEIAGLELFGLPEYDPDAAGVDVKVTSYPNVPNTDWLEVYYDAKDLTDGAVTSVDDLTPSGTNDGTATNVTVSDGAFVFNGTDSRISGSITQDAGAYVHTTTLWYYTNDDPATLADYIYQLGGGSTNTSPSIQISSGKLYISFMSNYYEIPVSSAGIVSKQWVHICYSYDGSTTTSSSVSVYINGVKMSMTGPLGGSAGNSLSLGANPQLRVGCSSSNGSVVNGKIANFRLFNRTLTSDEIYQLYTYQKEYFGHGDLGMTLKAGRLGIGTSEPRAALDVRGDIHGGCPTFFNAYRDAGNTSGAVNPLIWNKVTVNKGGCYNNVTGKFTASVSGYYRFDVYLSVENTGTGGTILLQWRKNDTDLTQKMYGWANVANHTNVAGNITIYLLSGDTFHVRQISGGMSSDNDGDAQSYTNGFTGFYLSS